MYNMMVNQKNAVRTCPRAKYALEHDVEVGLSKNRASNSKKLQFATKADSKYPLTLTMMAHPCAYIDVQNRGL